MQERQTYKSLKSHLILNSQEPYGTYSIAMANYRAQKQTLWMHFCKGEAHKIIPSIDFLVDNLISDKKRVRNGNRFILCNKSGSAKVKIIDDIKMITEAYKVIF